MGLGREADLGSLARLAAGPSLVSAFDFDIEQNFGHLEESVFKLPHPTSTRTLAPRIRSFGFLHGVALLLEEDAY